MSALIDMISCERPEYRDCWCSLRLLTVADVNAEDYELHTPLSKTAAVILGTRCVTSRHCLARRLLKRMLRGHGGLSMILYVIHD